MICRKRNKIKIMKVKYSCEEEIVWGKYIKKRLQQERQIWKIWGETNKRESGASRSKKINVGRNSDSNNNVWSRNER